jgi:hypothetical protein
MLALAGGMFFGAAVFLLVMKHFVEKKVLEPFYIYPGVAVASGLSALLIIDFIMDTWLAHGHGKFE